MPGECVEMEKQEAEEKRSNAQTPRQRSELKWTSSKRRPKQSSEDTVDECGSVVKFKNQPPKSFLNAASGTILGITAKPRLWGGGNNNSNPHPGPSPNPNPNFSIFKMAILLKVMHKFNERRARMVTYFTASGSVG